MHITGDNAEAMWSAAWYAGCFEPLHGC